MLGGFRLELLHKKNNSYSSRYKRIQTQNIGFIEVNSLDKEILERCVLVESRQTQYIEVAQRYFCGTVNEIWAGFRAGWQY